MTETVIIKTSENINMHLRNKIPVVMDSTIPFHQTFHQTRSPVQ